MKDFSSDKKETGTQDSGNLVVHISEIIPAVLEDILSRGKD